MPVRSNRRPDKYDNIEKGLRVTSCLPPLVKVIKTARDVKINPQPKKSGFFTRIFNWFNKKLVILVGRIKKVALSILGIIL